MIPETQEKVFDLAVTLTEDSSSPLAAAVLAIDSRKCAVEVTSKYNLGTGFGKKNEVILADNMTWHEAKMLLTGLWYGTVFTSRKLGA